MLTMLWQLLTSLPLAQIRKNDDDGGGWARLLPMIIIAVLYVLSSLAKGKQQKKNPTTGKPTPAPGPSRTSRPLPSYARKMSPQGAPAQSRPAPRPPTAAPPARPRPTSSQQRAAAGSAQPTTPWPAPTTTDRPIKVTAPTSAHRTAPKPQRPGARSAQAVTRVATTLPTSSARKKPAYTSGPESYLDLHKPSGNVFAGGALKLAMGSSQDLARAIAYSEILGPPRALRPFSPFGLPNP